MKSILLAFTALALYCPLLLTQRDQAARRRRRSSQATDGPSLAAAIKSAAALAARSLAGGNYGDAAIQAGANASWLKFVAAPGQTPIFSTLAINPGKMLIFDGVQVQSPNP